MYEGKEAQRSGNDDVHSTQRVLEGKRKEEEEGRRKKEERERKEGGRRKGCRPCEKGVEKMRK